MKLIDKLTFARNSVKRWEARRDEALRHLVHAENRLPRERLVLKRLERRMEKEQERPAPVPAPVEVTKVTKVTKVIEEAKKELPPPIDLDIPDDLKRDKAAADKIKAEVAESKRLRSTARALKVKGQVAERKAHADIPRSKRRWDTNNSKWIEA